VADLGWSEKRNRPAWMKCLEVRAQTDPPRPGNPPNGMQTQGNDSGEPAQRDWSDGPPDAAQFGSNDWHTADRFGRSTPWRWWFHQKVLHRGLSW